MRRTIRTILFWLAAIVIAVACSNIDGSRHNVSSAYYWSTVFRLDSAQQRFIENQRIDKIYLRYFDVVVDEQNRVMPNATVRFSSRQPQGVEVVPTVFIMNECMTRDVSLLDSLLLQRVMQMSETNDISGVREIQIDCDWTKTTRKTYYAFLERLARRAGEKNIRISATIRLHQLSQPVPPVERGVLMMYNTGDVRKYGGTNPILDMKDAGPYMRYLSDYELPLATAYPVFSWRVLFRDKHFIGILHTDDELPVLAEDTIVEYEPTLDVVMQAKQAVGRERKDANDEVILFDISETNIQRINKYHYEKVFLN